MASPQKRTKKPQKGDIIKSLEPWKCVPLFATKAEDQEVLKDLPQWNAAKHHPLASLIERQDDPTKTIPQLSKLLRRAVQRPDESWSIYTVVVAMNLVLQEGVSVVGQNNNTTTNRVGDDELSCEAWTWVQDRISWPEWTQLHCQVRQHLVLVSAAHPLVTYATETVPFLTRDKVTQVVPLLKLDQKFSLQRGERPKQTGTMAMRLSQILKDTYSSRLYGILLAPFHHDVTRNNESTIYHHHVRHACLPSAALEIESPTKLNLIALYDDNNFTMEQNQDDNSGKNNNVDGNHDHENNYCDDVTICTLPLDGGAMEMEARRRCCSNNWPKPNYQHKNEDPQSSSARHPDPCLLCRHDTAKGQPSSPPKSTQNHIPSLSWKHSIRLGHYYFQEERYQDATACYESALRQNDRLDDIRHAMGAIQLAQGKFLDAQFTWKDAAEKMAALGRTPAEKYQEGIGLQLKKQQAYKYFQQPNVTGTSNGVTDDSTRSSQESSGDNTNIGCHKKYPFQAYFENQCFVTPMLERTTCQKLIDIANRHGQWTTGRHYAVPTNDIPVHDAPELLEWFYPWMEQTCEPLLKQQFRIIEQQGNQQRFYVHDAFFVRYQGSSSTTTNTTTSLKHDQQQTSINNHLPCHLDECTHSFVICLNDEFEGGGTYFHDYDAVVSPKVGDVVSFKGDSLRHGGDTVVQGTRYILAVFLYLDHSCNSSGCQLLPRKTVGKPGKSTGNKHQIPSIFQEAKKKKTGFSFGFDMS